MRGIRSSHQLLIGMGVARQLTPARRLKLSLRRAARKLKPPRGASGRNFEAMVIYNYFIDTRSQTHVHGDTIVFSALI